MYNIGSNLGDETRLGVMGMPHLPFCRAHHVVMAMNCLERFCEAAFMTE
jgi:hypothetical protein